VRVVDTGRVPSAPAAPPLSRIARERKLRYFFDRIAPGAAILEVGCADGWVGRWAAEHGHHVTGLDLHPPADIVGDVRDWAALGLAPHSFDVIIAFEVIEHGDFTAALRDLLKPDGRLMVTTPVPRMDWACRLGEAVGLLQRRTSPHTHLVDVRDVPGFTVVDRRVVGLIAQWGVLRPA
jgi:cyclopropane fatty-acyl-phospholipid synthase-like methyltransferase